MADEKDLKKDLNSEKGVKGAKEGKNANDGRAGLNVERAKANMMFVTGYLALCIIFTIAYGIEFIKGARSIGYTIFTFVLAWIPWIFSYFVYKNKNDSKLIRELVPVGYAVFYTFALITSSSPNTFVYAVPMLILIAAYSDMAYSLRVGFAVVLINVISIVATYFIKHGEDFSMADVEIQVLLLIVSTIYLGFLTKHFNWVSQSRAKLINDEREKTEKMLNSLVDISGKIHTLTSDVSDKMTGLSGALNLTMSAMQEVNNGTGETVDAVEIQLTKTQEISAHVSHVEGVSHLISKDSDSVVKEIVDGRRSVDGLINQVEKSIDAGKSASEKLDKLNEVADKMGTIISVINNVTDQTSLLALNASIEAARAGEAGKGFAVVASEISSLAGQTSDATVQITDLVDGITEEISNVVGEIGNLLELNREQAKSATKTADNFENIAKSSDDITKQAEVLADAVKELAAANKEIVESIQTISAISEEVTAHSSETYNSSEQNEKDAKQVLDKIGELKNLADSLTNA